MLNAAQNAGVYAQNCKLPFAEYFLPHLNLINVSNYILRSQLSGKFLVSYHVWLGLHQQLAWFVSVVTGMSGSPESKFALHIVNLNRSSH